VGHRFGAVAAGLALLAAACGGSSNPAHPSPPGSGSGRGTVSVDQPGVTADVIRVGAVASVTNPIGGRYSSLFDGVKAYFEMADGAGGVAGRRLELVAQRDDQTAQNQSQVLALLEQDNVFAAMVATLVFTGADLLVQRGVPTFGWNVNTEWQKGPNLFGDKGSYFGYDRSAPLLPWLARTAGAARIGIVSYSVPQSVACARGDRASFDTFGGADVVFTDTSLPFGVTDLSADVAQMKKRGVQLVLTCIDENGASALGREMRKQGLRAPLYLPNSYDRNFIARFGDVLSGSFVMVQFTPFEVTDKPEGLQRFMTWMDKAGKPVDEVSLAGWVSADLLTTGLRAAGADFTRQKVIDALNRLTDYTAGGILPGIDWTVAHTGDPPRLCYALLEVVGQHLEPRFGAPGKPFICFDRDARTVPDQPARSG